MSMASSSLPGTTEQAITNPGSLPRTNREEATLVAIRWVPTEATHSRISSNREICRAAGITTLPLETVDMAIMANRAISDRPSTLTRIRTKEITRVIHMEETKDRVKDREDTQEATDTNLNSNFF